MKECFSIGLATETVANNGRTHSFVFKVLAQWNL